jgi:hypothetical protein
VSYPQKSEIEIWDGSKPVAWVCNPSARPWEEAWAWLRSWLKRGYGASIFRDSLADNFIHVVKASGAPVILLSGEYPGYARAANSCTKEVFRLVPYARWAICTGDDTSCDPNWHPEHIALQLEAYFGDSTFGVMQPTGCKFADNSITQIAGSAWIGREYCRRANGGEGPFYPPMTHMASDELLKFAAEQEGVYLMRPDLTHSHQHFTRIPGTDLVDWSRPVPEHLKWCNNSRHWNESRTNVGIYKSEYAAKWRPLPE